MVTLDVGEGWKISITRSSIKHGNGAYVDLYDFMWHGLHVQDREEDDTSLLS